MAAGLPIERIATDVHVGSDGGIQQIAGVFAKSPAFEASAINGEVNAIYGDGVNTASAMGRALSEASDINDWFNADAAVLARTIARTASFCSERNGHDDGSQWHQGLSFWLPNMTWLGPAGQYHVGGARGAQRARRACAAGAQALLERHFAPRASSS